MTDQLKPLTNEAAGEVAVAFINFIETLKKTTGGEVNVAVAFALTGDDEGDSFCMLNNCGTENAGSLFHAGITTVIEHMEAGEPSTNIPPITVN